ncbi:hypothetical protein [Aurantimonas sp. VKM B-3413]|uniref:hypothetical protein n=1 Tax=Aurantimonas sp. VKM B-3413 TaxID=2779401 RepID=UPI001E5095D4|nr:hypothetical protein [Aurantimonas sp. VKM B-3413]MCB8840157.1 hypothetical protein [Aurantimonas sp. VKM B-3413]
MTALVALKPTSAAVLFAVNGLSTLEASAATGSGSGLFEVSQRLVSAYNRGSADRIRRLMSPELKSRYSNAAVLDVIAQCKRRQMPHIVRTSLPVSGGRTYGFFAVYGDDITSSMILEVDQQDRIVFWKMEDDPFGGDFSCSFKEF